MCHAIVRGPDEPISSLGHCAIVQMGGLKPFTDKRAGRLKPRVVDDATSRVIAPIVPLCSVGIAY